MNEQPPAGSSDAAAFDSSFHRSYRSPEDEAPGKGDDSSSSEGSSFGAGLGGASEGKAPAARKKRKSAPRRKAVTRRKKAASSTAVVEPDEGSERDDDAPAPRKKRSRRKKASSKAKAEDRPDEPLEERSDEGRSEGEESGEDGGSGKKRRRRGSRGGRRRKKSSSDEDGREDDRDDPRDDARGGDSAEDSDAHDRAGRAGGRKRASRKKSTRRSSKRSSAAKEGAAVDTIPGEEDELPEARPEKKSKKKRKRSRSKKSGRGDDERDEDEVAGGSKKKRKRSSKKKDAAPELTAEEKAEAAEALRTDVIYINASDPEESRVAVVNPDGRIHDLLMTSESQKTLVNDIYRGRVVNLEPAIGAAFVDFGQGRNGFLHTSDVLPMYGEDGFSLDQLLTASVDPDEWDSTAAQATVGGELNDDDLDDGEDADDRGRDEDDDEGGSKGSRRKKKSRRKKASSKGKGKAAAKDAGRGSSRRRARLPISELLKVGDQVVVQVTKDAIGDKGPTLTTYISIPGRYLVLMPSMARTGVSRKIPDDKERRRLKRILASLKSPTEMGVIVRTAGVGKTKTDLQRDLNYLLGVWETFGKKLKAGRGPAALYQESDVAIRTLRDLFNKTTKKVVVDDPGVLEQLDEFAEDLMPEHRERIQRYTGDRPIFHDAGIEQDFEKIFARRVELASGGSVVFDQAEALVAIDVNSGRTRTDSFDFEEIALKTNLEAVPEIALQIRLRDLGGIIVCDFIDMMKSSSNRAVERALRAELAPDRARSKLGRISQFGLLELTRQRLGPGTHKKVFQACPRCRGTARIRTVESRAQAILRRLGSALTQKGFSKVEVRAHPEVVEYLKEDLWDYMRALEHRFEKELTLTAVPEQPEDSVLRYLRADGREVRPGGRRKR